MRARFSHSALPALVACVALGCAAQPVDEDLDAERSALSVSPTPTAPAQAFVWSDRFSGDFVASSMYSYNPKRLPVRVHTVSAGRYEVTFEGLAGSGGNVTATAYDAPNARCQVESWRSVGSDLLTTILCFDRAGAPTSSRFAAWYVRGGVSSGAPGHAYLWASSGTVSHTPSTSYQYSSAGGTHTVTRSGVGQYRVTLENQGTTGGTVMVTAYGSTAAYCNIAGWGGSPSLTAEVRCYDPAGAPVDNRFTLRFVKGTPGRTTDLQYLWAYSPTASAYDVSGSYQLTNGTRLARITRSGTGSYSVLLPSTVAVESTVAVTAYGSNASCQVSGWHRNVGGTNVRVRCYAPSGTLADSRFTLAYQNGPSDFRALTDAVAIDSPTTVTSSRWEGHVRVGHPSETGATLVAVPIEWAGFAITDHWYRNTDGSLSKSIVDRGRAHRGVFTLRADGSNQMAIDLDSDGTADIVEMVGADHSRRFLVSEGIGRRALDAWLAGTNPLCVGTGPDLVTPEDLAGGLMLGCPGSNYRDLVSSLPTAVDPLYRAPTTPHDPLDSVCAELGAARPSLFSGGTQSFDFAEELPVTALLIDITNDVISNGFDGVADGAGDRAARTIIGGPVAGVAIFLAFEVDALAQVRKLEDALTDPVTIAQELARRANERREREAAEASGGDDAGTGGEDAGGTEGEDAGSGEGDAGPAGDAGGTEERPLDQGTSEMLQQACAARGTRGSRRDELRAALRPRCDDPDAFGSPTLLCSSVDDITEADADGALRAGASCSSATGTDSIGGTCREPAGLTAAITRVRYHGMSLEGLAICNPIVCNPGL